MTGSSMIRSLASLAQQLGLRVSARQSAALGAPCSLRGFSTIEAHKDEIESINELFVEARDEIEYAKEEAETVYFNESCDTARKVVQDVLDKYQAVLGQLSEEERGKLQRSMGLKMEQLKAEVGQLDTLHD